MHGVARTTAAAVIGLALMGSPAAAQTVVDGSDRNLPAEDVANVWKLIHSRSSGNTAGIELRRLHKADTVTSVMYCGEIRGQGIPDFVPFLVNLSAGLLYALVDGLPEESRREIRGRLAIFGCLKR